MKHVFPTQFAMIELWLATHFQGVPCAVFFTSGREDPRRAGSIMDHLRIADQSQRRFMLDGEVIIHPVTGGESVDDYVNHLPGQEFGFVMAWDGASFTTENS